MYSIHDYMNAKRSYVYEFAPVNLSSYPMNDRILATHAARILGSGHEVWYVANENGEGTFVSDHEMHHNQVPLDRIVHRRSMSVTTKVVREIAETSARKSSDSGTQSDDPYSPQNIAALWARHESKPVPKRFALGEVWIYRKNTQYAKDTRYTIFTVNEDSDGTRADGGDFRRIWAPLAKSEVDLDSAWFIFARVDGGEPEPLLRSTTSYYWLRQNMTRTHQSRLSDIQIDGTRESKES